MSCLQIRNLSVYVKQKLLFNNLSLQMNDGDLVGLHSPTGTGKTTLLNLIAGVADTNEITAEGDFIRDFRRVSYVYQDSTLLPELTVLKNVMLPIEKIFGKKEAENKALEMLRLVEMDHKCYEKAKNLSGGEKQRTAIARAFLFPGEILLMDEPFHAQDEIKKEKLIRLTKEIATNEKRMVIVVSHDKTDLQKLGAKIIMIAQN